MVRKTPVPFKLFLALMSAGFPFAYALFVAAGIVFFLFNLASLLSATDPRYGTWLEVSQPFTDAVAKIVPAVDDATAFLQQRRDFLEERDSLYWIPATRNVLAIDFAMILFLPLCYGVLLWIDLLRDRERALASVNELDAATRERGYSLGYVLARLALFLSIFFLPVYFGLFGVVRSLISFAGNMSFYFIVLGVDGLALLLATPHSLDERACLLGGWRRLPAIRRLRLFDALMVAPPQVLAARFVGWVELLRYPSAAVDGFRKSSTHPTSDPQPQWLLRGMLFWATRWYLTAGLSTMPSAS